MITDTDKEVIVKCAKKYNVSCVILFGSALRDHVEANDIDIAVKGVERELFFKFYAELFKNLSRLVDLVHLSRKSLFNDLIEENGVVIYG